MKFFFLLVFWPFISVIAQNDEDKIYWIEEGLTWEDFKASPPGDAAFHANTSAGLSYGWSMRSENGITELKYEVKSYFNPYSSWVVPGSESEYLLKHEQLHFDITELHARKLRKKLAAVESSQLGNNPKPLLSRIYQSIEKERAQMQAKFDRETNHSLNKEAEARWRDYVKREMKKFEAFDI